MKTTNRRLIVSWHPEAPVRLAIVRAIKRRWPDAFIYHSSDRFRAGIPDLLICVPPGRFVACEIKSKAGRLAPIQEATLAAVRHAGGIAGVARSVEDALTLCRNV